MAKVKGPLLSLGGSGQIGKAVVFGNWKGVDYARAHVVPANPQSVEQTVTRDLFTSLSAFYKKASAQTKAPWVAYATGKPLTDRNAFIKFNLGVMRGGADSALFVGSPGALGGPAPYELIGSTGAGAAEINVTVGNVAAPSGWTLAAVNLVFFINSVPEAIGSVAQQTDTDATPTIPGSTTFVLTAAFASTLHTIAGWNVWTRPDGRTAYSPGLTDQATSNA